MTSIRHTQIFIATCILILLFFYSFIFSISQSNYYNNGYLKLESLPPSSPFVQYNRPKGRQLRDINEEERLRNNEKEELPLIPNTPNEQKMIKLPVFTNQIRFDSLCDENHLHYSATQEWCKGTKCMMHTKPKIDNDKEKETGCKTLWFAGMYDDDTNQCKVDNSGYQNMYGAALNSAIINADESLQPVLMLGRLGFEEEGKNVTAKTKFGLWAEQKGAKVITVPRLSFQEVIDKHYPNENFAERQGPWLRLEIPRLIKEHGLFDLPNICNEHVLYTDSDVIFASKVSKKDIKYLSDRVSSANAEISYGREYYKRPEKQNTGVMVINVDKFANVVPKMIDYLDERGPQPSFDQGLINNYFGPRKKVKRRLLPIEYNWKVYWQLEPSTTINEVKIIHMHGPKPGRGLEAIASCNYTNIPLEFQNGYDKYLRQGICCDKGRTASWTMDALTMLYPTFDEICNGEQVKNQKNI